MLFFKRQGILKWARYLRPISTTNIGTLFGHDPYENAYKMVI